MTRYYPVLSESILEDCGDYERFQLTNGTIWHRYAMNGEIVWILIFADEVGSDKENSERVGMYFYLYSKYTKLWYLKHRPMGEFPPNIESWYQDYLKSRAS